jgi:hypothetical protein
MLGSGKILYGLDKRDYPQKDVCELCGVAHPNKNGKGCLFYHHWDDNNPSIGLWTCFHCHYVAEAVDEGNAEELVSKYLLFKAVHGYKHAEQDFKHSQQTKDTKQ